MRKKYEREILELLEKMDSFVPEESRFERAGRRLSQLRQHLLRGVSAAIGQLRISPTTLLVASLMLAILGYGLHGLVAWVASYISAASLALFLAAFAVHIANRRKRQTQHRWRGRVIELREYRRGHWPNLRYYWQRARTRIRRWLNRRSWMI
ncbi:MAG: hypothetical protein HY675_26070 [Chloroflexi bacterium]|nr:hypothetical protein [Chloroflexota bacterium]